MAGVRINGVTHVRDSAVGKCAICAFGVGARAVIVFGGSIWRPYTALSESSPTSGPCWDEPRLDLVAEGHGFHPQRCGR